MPSYIVGDELGSIKRIQYVHKDASWQAEPTILSKGSSKSKCIQKLAIFRQADSESLLAVARADGSASISSLTDNGAELVAEWKETRLKEGQKYVGIAVSSRGTYTCTSNGALRLTGPGRDEYCASSQLASLPMRLAEWRLSSNEESFVYAGDEVELSMWNTETAFSVKMQDTTDPDTTTKKRKRGDQLLPGETWRAKNLPNDSLNLRQPVRNTALTFLQPSAPSHHHIVVGTQLGDVRRYDTRAARRPVANWTGIGKVGGIGVVEKGHTENELFVADKGCNLFSLDLRNGKVCYGYKGLAAAVTSISPSMSLLASGAHDRFVRLHSTFPPPTQVGQQQEDKGQVLDNFYLKVVPTVIVADIGQETQDAELSLEEDEVDPDDVWDQLEVVEHEDDIQKANTKKTKKRKALA